MKYKKYFKKFVDDLDAKMQKGYEEYGDKSFSKEPQQLIQELIEEVEDICGWGLILKVRLEQMKEVLNEK